MKTATMVAAVSRARGDETFVSPEENALLEQLAAGLELTSEEVQQLRESAETELNDHPNLWQVLYGCLSVLDKGIQLGKTGFNSRGTM